MPPRAKSGPDATGRASDSRSLVSTGPKDVQKHYGKRDERQREIRPTTERALVLRNGKHGVQGTGEMILMMKMTGREKLDLLAEDLVEKANKSLLTPFRMELCLKLAESQLSENLDDIANLKDPDLFFPLVEEEIKSRDASDTKRKNGTGSTGDPSYNAEIISNRIHNAYMLGSAWKIAVDLLYSLQEGGLFDESVVSTLKTDDRLRSQYLTLYDLVNTLVDLQQAKLSVLATTTPHYASYFKESVNETGEKEFFFDWQETRKACSSFLDSIIVELCFPGAPYAKAILYQILHDAIEESPRDARRFPQLLWDFVGDLSVTVQLQQILETPLLSLDGRQWKAEDRQKYDPYDRWVAAQLHSQIASDKWANLKDIISPLHRTKTKETLDAMWKIIDNNYKEACDKDIGALWGLTEVLNPKPHWHSYGLVRRGNDDDDYDDSPPKITGKAPNNLLEITSGEQTDDSMPGLAEISDSDEDVEWGDNDDKEEESDHDTDDDESGYGSDQESLMRAMVREAMNAVTAVNWQEPPDENDELDPFTAEDRKGNPFLNLLGSLRGRMFSKSSKLKTTASTNSPRAKPATSASISVSANRPQTGPTIEEVSDEEDDISHAKKKKKKKPKKKKKKPAAADGDAPATPDIPASPPLTSPAPAAKVQAKSPSLVKPKVAVAASQSTTSFYPLETVTTAQSARSYRQSEHIDAPKVKVKSRSAQPSIFSSTKGLLDKLGVGKEKDKDATADKKERCGWFAKLGKKTRKSMHQILNTAEDETKGMAGMKWDAFVKVLTDLGFKYDPSTAGSSVRFDPPDPRDRSISFHKPHPDSTISRVLLKEYSKKLRKYYGWDPKDIMDLS
ncbi:hypothetical protein F5890DRAFT_1474338 [Lentinula detonsa]|uniref:Uncharacterized protein n=1 Tax=Lentinula detonsa TaxID=2804962 RepID=A0AA38US46_9AGAR|nr:hypothetical protein F5890DRAFT_1474338 [Lentinula detonsa]